MLSITFSPYVFAETKKCRKCGECVEKCPARVLEIQGFLWNKKIEFQNPLLCIGCKKCVTICKYGVFSE